MNRKKIRFLSVCFLLSLMLLTGCQQNNGPVDGTEDSPANIEDNFDMTGDESVDGNVYENTDPSIEYAYSDAVFDRSKTAGSFACYYFRSNYTRPNPVGNSYSGDSALLIAPDGTTMLIDFNMDPVTSHVVSYLQRLGITKLDYLMASHTDMDHCGGYEVLLENIEVEHVYITDSPYYKSTDIKAGRFLAKAVEQGATYTILTAGMNIDFGGVNMEIFWPTADIVWSENPTSAETNDLSIVAKFVYGESSFLFSGDINTTQEIKLVEMYGDKLQADVLKMNHHGLKSSNSQKWTNTIQPKLICGMAAVVHSSEVLERYMFMEIPFTLSVLDGTTVVWTDGNGEYNVQVEKDREDAYFGLLPSTDGYFQVK